MAKPQFLELSDAEPIPILFEDRSVIAIDKPAGWMLVPHSWQRTGWNLQAAINSSINAGHYWARSRNLKFLRYIHRLDADTSGVLLFGKSFGAVETYGDLFESRQMEKRYLAIVHGQPRDAEWTCRLALSANPQAIGSVHVDEQGKECETFFRTLATKSGYSLVEAHPFTGRQHQIRVHLNAVGHGILGDPLYGPSSEQAAFTRPAMALRSVELSYRDPFTKRPVRIQAAAETWLKKYGWEERTKNSRSRPLAAPPSSPQKPASEKRGALPLKRI